jgi:hypothetical protein
MAVRRPALVIGAMCIAFALSAGMLAFTLPGLIDTWHTARAPAPPRARHADRPAVRVPVNEPATPAPAASDDGTDWVRLIALWWGVWTVVGTVVLTGLAGVLLRRRLRDRLTRRYGLYEIHLSMHDQAKPQDLEDMVEALANVVRQFPEDRARHGQPFIAVELHYGPADHGMEWTLALRCETKVASAIDGVLCAAYPDVRLGHRFGGRLAPLRRRLAGPGHVLRYRKDRSFVYALSSESDKDASPPIEAIAQEQAAVGTPSSVRFQFTPASLFVESWARRRFARHENALARSETWGATEAGLRGSLNQQEMREAKRTQNRSMFWLEVQVAAETREDANHIGAAVQARRGDNRLHRRWMTVRVRRYCRRFASAYPPLWPTLSMRALASSVEIGHLLELPSARMKNVPVRRGTLPRMPAPPEVHPGVAELPRSSAGATGRTTQSSRLAG